MPRSPVQFQKGQSLAEFTDRYGSEEQCRAALFQAEGVSRMRATLLPAALPQCLPMQVAGIRSR